MEEETQQPKMASENQVPPSEIVGEIQPPQDEMVGDMQLLPACVYKVLDDNNLLAEIIVRLGFPTSLVRAASVCRHWLRLASDRAFLRWFRKLHPPRLLGFYLAQRDYPDAAARFFPMLPQPRPTELAAVVHRASFCLDLYEGKVTSMVGCWNGRVITSLHVCHLSIDNDRRDEITFAVHSPLCSDRGMAVIPALHLPVQEGNFCTYRKLFSKEEGAAMSYFYVMVESTEEFKSVVQVFVLQNGDDSWRTHLTLTVDYLIYALSSPRAVLVDNKIYMVTKRDEILVSDLTASSFSTIQLPQGVDSLKAGTATLSGADDASAVYLIHAKELQLHIWLHKRGHWLLADYICLREMCGHLLEDEPTSRFRVNHMGDYTGEFLFLEIGRCAYYLDVKCRMLRKVYEMAKEDRYLGTIYPFMMIWPPIFPVLKDGPARFVSLRFDDLYNALLEVT